MEIIISESQLKSLIVPKPISHLSNITNHLLSKIITFIKVLSRSFQSLSDEKVKEILERVQSLTKQSIANDRTDLTEEEMKLVRKTQKYILNTIATKNGFTNWNDLKRNHTKLWKK